jgi:hypothetical protein
MLPTGADITRQRVTFFISIVLVSKGILRDVILSELSAIQGIRKKSHRESRLDRLGRLFPFTLGVLDRRCDDIASSVLCTASAYLDINISISKAMGRTKMAHAQKFITYELAFELFVMQSRSDELILSESAHERYHS